MLVIYKNIEPHILHVWYNHDDAINYHQSYINHKFSKQMKKCNMWLSILVDGNYNEIIANATEVYIHGRGKSCIDMCGFDSLRRIEFMESYRYFLVNIRQSTITIVSGMIPNNLDLKEVTTISNKLINSNGKLKHFIHLRSAYLIEPPQSREKILHR